MPPDGIIAISGKSRPRSRNTSDPVSGMDDLAALLNQLKEANIPHDAEVFGGARHSFTVPGSRDYDEQADEKSWDALQRFLARLG